MWKREEEEEWKEKEGRFWTVTTRKKHPGETCTYVAYQPGF